MTFLACLIGTTAVVLALAYLAGIAIDPMHRTRISLPLCASPQRLWEVITDVAEYSKWCTAVTHAEKTFSLGTRERWLEYGRYGARQEIEIRREADRTRLVMRTVEADTPVSLRWEFTISQHGNGSLLRVEEVGEIRSPLLRVVARYVVGYDDTLGTYLRELAGHLERPGPLSARRR